MQNKQVKLVKILRLMSKTALCEFEINAYCKTILQLTPIMSPQTISFVQKTLQKSLLSQSYVLYFQLVLYQLPVIYS